MKVKLADKPYWKKYYDERHAYENFKDKVKEATNLWEAILAGGNMTYLDRKYVGYVEENGEIVLYEDYIGYTKEQLENIKVCHGRVAKDFDGYPCAYYFSEE